MSQPLTYLQAYPAELLDKVRALLDQGQLGQWLARRYPERHDAGTDRALRVVEAELAATPGVVHRMANLGRGNPFIY